MIKRVIESVIGNFSDDYMKMLNEISTTKKFEKNDIILGEGKFCNHLWFINKGAVKAFESINGIDRTIYFFTENAFFSNYYCWVTGNPSDITFQVIESSEIIEINYPELEKLCTKHHIFDSICRKIAERIFVEEYQLRKLLLNFTAIERYEHLENTRPEIFQRFPLKDIAGFIGVTDVSLSRLRKNRKIK